MSQLLYATIVHFFFNDTATTEIYTLSLHDALPIFVLAAKDEAHADGLSRELGELASAGSVEEAIAAADVAVFAVWLDRKSTRLNSSHMSISYAVFCLKKKK